MEHTRSKHQRLWHTIQDAWLLGDQMPTDRYGILLHGDAMHLIARIILEEKIVRNMDVQAVAGPSMAAALLVSAVTMESCRSGGGVGSLEAVRWPIIDRKANGRWLKMGASSTRMPLRRFGLEVPKEINGRQYRVRIADFYFARVPEREACANIEAVIAAINAQDA